MCWGDGLDWSAFQTLQMWLSGSVPYYHFLFCFPPSRMFWVLVTSLKSNCTKECMNLFEFENLRFIWRIWLSISCVCVYAFTQAHLEQCSAAKRNMICSLENAHPFLNFMFIYVLDCRYVFGVGIGL